MWLQDRDFRSLTEEETKAYHHLLEIEKVKVGKLSLRKSQWRNYPPAARKFITLFPNNYLDPLELKSEAELSGKIEAFQNLLGSDRLSEREVLNHIRQNCSHFIIGSLLKERYTFGHHETFVFPEFKLGNSHVCDYLIIGRSSGGYEFVFVELEDPMPGSTINGGDFGVSIRKGLRQLEDWRSWIEAHFSSLREFFYKEKGPNCELEKEFINLDLSRIHCLLVAGRRQDYTERTYRLRRELEKERKTILHYDNVLEDAKFVVGKDTY